MMIVPPGVSHAERVPSPPPQEVTSAAEARSSAGVRMRGVGAGGRERWELQARTACAERRRTGSTPRATSSSIPSPRVVLVVDDETRGLGTELVVDEQRLRTGIFDLAYRRRQCLAQLLRRWRTTQRRGESRRRRNRRERVGSQSCQHTLIILHQDRAMLQHRSVGAPLRAAGEFPAAKRELAGPWLVEARRRTWRGAAGLARGNPSVDADSGETGDEQAIDALVRSMKIARVAHRRGDAVRDLAIV